MIWLRERKFGGKKRVWQKMVKGKENEEKDEEMKQNPNYLPTLST